MLNFAAGNPITGYNLSRSLRFRASASAHLGRVFGSGDRKTWTLSFWVKRGSLGSNQSILVSGPANTSDSTFGNIGFNSSDQFTFTGYGVTWRTTTQVFRDRLLGIILFLFGTAPKQQPQTEQGSMSTDRKLRRFHLRFQ